MKPCIRVWQDERGGTLGVTVGNVKVSVALLPMASGGAAALMTVRDGTKRGGESILDSESIFVGPIPAISKELQ